MKRRILPLALITASMVVVYACSDDKGTTTPPVDDSGTTPPVQEDSSTPVDGSKPIEDGSIPDTSKADTSVPTNSNPIDGIAAPAAVAITNGIYTEGPVWFGDGLYFSELTAGGPLIKLTPPNTTQVMRNAPAGVVPLGNTIDEKSNPNTILTLEVNEATQGASIVRTPVTGAPPRTGTPLVLVTDAGVAPMFDSPNDLVVRKSDGTIYITDPSYQAQAGGGVTGNHIWRVKPVTNEVFEIPIDGRPNGIALAPTDNFLYISFTDPPGAPAPAPPIMKYPVNADGSLGVATKFADVPPGGGQLNNVNSLADGLAVDSAGNVYCAVKNGVEVFKPDGTKWGKITTAKAINGLAFGGTDKKTLFMTTTTGILSVVVKIAGQNQ